jgi:Predicted membrane protein
MNQKVKKITYTGLLAALCFLGTYLIHIPSFSQGYWHIGDSMVFLTGAVLGPVYGGVAAGIGSMLADLAGGYAIWMPATFIIKFIMAAVMGLFLKKSATIANVKTVIAMVIGVIVLVAGYYLAGSLLVNNFISPLADCIGNMVQGIVGSIIGFVVMVVFDRTKLTSKIRG